jgi:hypothetical protein
VRLRGSSRTFSPSMNWPCAVGKSFARFSSGVAHEVHPFRKRRIFPPLRKDGIVGISLGGILVIVGIVLMFVWSFWAGLIVALIGLIAFGGFARGKWY